MRKLVSSGKLISTAHGRQEFIAKLRIIYLRLVLKKLYPNFIPMKAFNGVRWLLPTQNAGTEWFYSRPNFDRTGMQGCLDLLRIGDTVLDIGANHGYYSVLFADKVGNNGKVVAIEAFPDTTAILQKQIERRGNCKIIQTPLWSSVKKINLDFDSELPDAQRSIRLTGPTTIQSKTLNLIWEELGKPEISLVKLDVEGCELEVMKGGDQLWTSASPPWLYVEINPDTLARFETTSEQLIAYLVKLGYELFLPGESPSGGGRIVELAKLRGYVNAFARPPIGEFQPRKVNG